METKTTKGASAWLELATSASLPILTVSAQLLVKQIKAGASLADMTHTVERDPALCLHLFLAANRKSNQPDNAILNLNQMITTLGMQGVVDCIKQAPKMSLHKSDAQQKGYLQAQSVSALAGALVEHWAKQTHSGSGEKLKWATILAGAPSWHMWYVSYGNMHNWHYRLHHERRLSADVEQAIFGDSLDTLYLKIAQHIQLPTLSLNLLQPEKWPSLRQWSHLLSDNHMRLSDDDNVLRHIKSQPVTIMLLLTHLAQQVQNGWMSHKALRSEKVLAHLSGLDLNQVISQNHQLAVDMSRKRMVQQILPPAVSLLWPQQTNLHSPWARPAYACWSEPPSDTDLATIQHEQKDKPVEHVPSKTPKLKVVASRVAERDVIVDVLQHLNRKISDFKDIHTIFLSCNKALHKGIGMRRGFICILNKSGDCLRPVYCFGVQTNDPIRSLRISLKENRLFHKLVEKSASFRVDRANAEQAMNMLAADAAETLSSKNFMVMSLFAKNRPVGVVYVDVSNTEQPISEQEYSAFKQVCKSTSLALERYKLSR